MLLRRIFDDRLAQATYLVVCEHDKLAMVVDPNRNIQQYIDAAARDNARITHVTETHIHADFVSGARELARTTGSTLLLSDAGDKDSKYAFADDEVAELLGDGSSFTVGDIRVDAIHTPGHTPEHLAFLLTDTSSAGVPMGALTGDFIFVGDVGRPDLLERAAGKEGTMETAARQLFRSVQQFKSRPDYLQLWPGHGAGSACGKALGAMPQTTLGYEKLFNWALVEENEDEFVERVLRGQPEPPAYFARMKQLNRDGRLPADLQVAPRMVAADVAACIRSGSVVVDTRPTSEFTNDHAAGTLNIPRTRSFLTYAGSVIAHDASMIFVGTAYELSRRELSADLSLIGFDKIEGVLPTERLSDLTKLIGSESIPSVTSDDVEATHGASLLDVRGRSEFAAGHLPQAINIPLGELQTRIRELPEGNLLVNCQGGTRSVIAASILQRDGRSGISNMLGGFAEWERTGHPVERGSKKTGV